MRDRTIQARSAGSIFRFGAVRINVPERMMRVRRLSLFVTAVLLASSNRGRLPAAEELPRAIAFEAEVSAVRIERIRRGRGGMRPQVWLHPIPGEKRPGVSGESVRCYRLARAYLVEHVAAAFGIRPERVYCPKWMVETPYEIYFELDHGGIFARDALQRCLTDDDEGVRAKARWALSRLRSRSASARA